MGSAISHAKALLRVGQMHRQVFGTLANSQSSRSHALVTIKVLRVHRGERNVRAPPRSLLCADADRAHRTRPPSRRRA